jgi:hypothetical protein
MTELSGSYTDWSTIATIANGRRTFEKILRHVCQPMIQGCVLTKVDARVAFAYALFNGNVKVRLFVKAIDAAKNDEKLRALGDIINKAADALSSCDRATQPEMYEEQIMILSKIYSEELYDKENGKPYETKAALLLYYLKEGIPSEKQNDHEIIAINSEYIKKITSPLQLRV